MLKEYPLGSYTYNKDSITIPVGADRVTFELPCVYTRGVNMHNNRLWYEIPISLDIFTASEIRGLAEKYNAVNPVSGCRLEILNLASYSLSQKQRDELLDKGKSYVLINFIFEGVLHNKSTDRNNLSFRITKLRKTKYLRQSDVPPED